MMRAFTLHRVWAGMVALGWKPYEFRNARPTACIGQRVAIHAGHRDGDLDAFRALAGRWPGHVRRRSPQNAAEWCLDDAPAGHIVCAARVGLPIDLHADFVDSSYLARIRCHLPPGYESVRWAIPLLEVRRLAYPIPCRGSVTLGWRVPDDVAARVLGLLRLARDEAPGE